MTEAIFGLVGVVVGAMITSGAEFLREWRRERSEATVGIRLLEHELTVARSACDVALETGYWAGGRGIPGGDWHATRAVLSGKFSRAEWQAVAHAIAYVDHLCRAFERQLKVLGDAPGVEMSANDRDFVSNAGAAIDRALTVIREHAGPWE